MKLRLAPYDLLTKKVNAFNFNKLDAEQIEKEIIDIMLKHDGLGLAANQVGLDARVFAIHNKEAEPFAVFNPQIIESSNDKILREEGCLSYPDLWMKVKRPEHIVVKFTNSQGKTIQEAYNGLLSRVFQHEYDHLDGICYVDRVSKLVYNIARKRKKKIAGNI